MSATSLHDYLDLPRASKPRFRSVNFAPQLQAQSNSLVKIFQARCTCPFRSRNSKCVYCVSSQMSRCNDVMAFFIAVAQGVVFAPAFSQSGGPEPSGWQQGSSEVGCHDKTSLQQAPNNRRPGFCVNLQQALCFRAHSGHGSSARQLQCSCWLT